jgi:methylated-DNA-[protein]-cysteine S-methyltransferase
MTWTTHMTPLGDLTLTARRNGLRNVYFPESAPSFDADCNDPAPLATAIAQLNQYFAGERRAFDLEVDLVGTAFQKRVWQAVQRVRYGSTTTYSALAHELGVTGSGNVSAARKVAWAVAATPTPIVVPCHRVIAANGSLTGYLGGLDRKRALLDFEASDGTAVALRVGRRQLTLL